MDVHILGALEATDGARHVDLGLRQARVTFAALALQRGLPVPIDRLAEAVWPNGTPARWESALYSHISRLRRALEPQRPPNAPSARIETLGCAYVLHLEAEELDAHRFERLGAEGRAALGQDDAARAHDLLRAALGEWRGRVLADLGDLPFAASEAHRLEELRRVVVEERIEAELALGRHAAAAVELERIVAEHPLRERAWELLLLALYRSGRQADALRRYQAVRTILGDELGIEPGPGLRALEERILQHDVELGPERGSASVGAAQARTHTAVVPVPAPRPAWLAPAGDVFVGRHDELAALGREWARAGGRARRLVLVTGEPGIGKTRLVREVCARGADHGAIVLGGRCAEEPMHALEPFAEAIGRVALADPTRFAAADAAPLAWFVPEIVASADAPRTDDSEDQRYLVSKAVSHALDSRVLGGPVVLVLDDVQWARTPTVHLLAHLLRAEDAGPLLVVATHRDTEVNEDLDALIGELHRERRLHRIGLVGLDPDDVGALARARGSVAAVEEIAAMTEGNPFYVEELVRHVAESGGLLGPEAVPESVRDTIALRLLRLPDAVRRLLGIAAVAGQQFDLDVVAGASGVAVDDADDALTLAARARMVAEHPRRVGAYTFSHALIRTVLRDDLGTARQARIHRRLGEAIAVRHPHRDAEIAHHLLAAAGDGSDPMPGVRHARAAAARAVERYAYDDAAALLEAAYRHLPDDAERVMRCTMLLELALATFLTGHRYDDVPELLTRAEAIADETDDPVLCAQVLLESYHVNLDQDPWAKRVEALLDRLDEESAQRIVLTAMLARRASSSPGGRGRRLGEWALARCDTLDHRDRKLVLETAQHVLDAWSPPERVLELAQSARDAARASGDRRYLVTALASERVARLATGDLRGSDEVGREYEEVVEALRQPRYRAGVAQRRAMRALLAGRFAQAEVHAEESIGLQPTTEFVEGYAVQLFALRYEQGRLAEVRPLIEAWASEYDRPAWAIGLGVLLAELGEHDEARAVLDPHATTGYAEIPRDDLWFLALAAAATATERLHDAEGAAALYEILAAHAPRVVVAGQGALCWGSIHRHLAPLAAMLGAHDRASMHWESAMSMHERLGARAFLARDRLGYARFLCDTDGDVARARNLARTGLAIARELGMDALLGRHADLDEIAGGDGTGARRGDDDRR